MAEDEDRTLAAKLARLFAVHRLVPRQVAEAINTEHGERMISKQYLYQLLNGEKTNPTWKHLELLASYFQVSTEYFRDTDESRRLAEQYELLAAVQQGEITELAARWPGMTAGHRSALVDLAKTFAEMDQPEDSSS